MATGAVVAVATGLGEVSLPQPAPGKAISTTIVGHHHRCFERSIHFYRRAVMTFSLSRSLRKHVISFSDSVSWAALGQRARFLMQVIPIV